MSSPRRIGLPETKRMRHDIHFVDQLIRPNGAPIGKLIPTEDIDPNPNQPRREMGDLAELTASIKEKGLLEPIIVRSKDGRYQIIAGERRFRAALEAGLPEIPCVVRDATDTEVMEIALIENLQRKDLHPFEEADGLRTLAETYQYTHEKMAEKLGKSRTTITEILSLSSLPDDIRKLCRLADIGSKSLLLHVVRQSDPQKMIGFIQKIQQEGHISRTKARDLAKAEKRNGKGRPRHYVFQLKAKPFSLMLKFKSKAEASVDEIIDALRAAIQELEQQSKSKLDSN